MKKINKRLIKKITDGYVSKVGDIIYYRGIAHCVAEITDGDVYYTHDDYDEPNVLCSFQDACRGMAYWGTGYTYYRRAKPIVLMMNEDS